MTDDTTTEKLALKLANLASDWVQAKARTRAWYVAEAKLDGAAEVANILGYGHTPSHVQIEFICWARDCERPVDNSAMRIDAKRWVALAKLQGAKLLTDMERS